MSPSDLTTKPIAELRERLALCIPTTGLGSLNHRSLTATLDELCRRAEEAAAIVSEKEGFVPTATSIYWMRRADAAEKQIADLRKRAEASERLREADAEPKRSDWSDTVCTGDEPAEDDAEQDAKDREEWGHIDCFLNATRLGIVVLGNAVRLLARKAGL